MMRLNTILALILGLCIMAWMPVLSVLAAEHDLSTAETEADDDDDLYDDDENLQRDLFANMFDEDNDDVVVPDEVRSEYLTHEAETRRDDSDYFLPRMLDVVDEFGNKDGKVHEDEMFSFHDYNMRRYYDTLMQRVKHPGFDHDQDGTLSAMEVDKMLDFLVHDLDSHNVMDYVLVYRFDKDDDQMLNKEEYAALKDDESEIEEAIAEAKPKFLENLYIDLFEGGESLPYSKWTGQIEAMKKGEDDAAEAAKTASDKQLLNQELNVDVPLSLCDIISSSQGSINYYDNVKINFDMGNPMRKIPSDCYLKRDQESLFKSIDKNTDYKVDKDEMSIVFDTILDPMRSAKKHFHHKMVKFFGMYKDDSKVHINKEALRLPMQGPEQQLLGHAYNKMVYDTFVKMPAMDFGLDELIWEFDQEMKIAKANKQIAEERKMVLKDVIKDRNTAIAEGVDPEDYDAALFGEDDFDDDDDDDVETDEDQNVDDQDDPAPPTGTDGEM